MVVHPDFIPGFALAREIGQCEYFSYAVNEALHLSQEEELTINRSMMDISRESEASTDRFSQHIIMKHLELLLNYCDRFYHHQFLTRNQGNNNLLSEFENLLEAYFE